MWSAFVATILILSISIGCVFLLLFTTVFCYRLWMEPFKGVCKCKTKLHGKVVLITGGNSGIGLETAKDLAKRGARIVIASRNDKKSENAVAIIKDASGNENVEYRHLNLAKQDSIVEFADKFNKDFDRLDILVNNAGCGAVKTVNKENGVDILMQINYVGLGRTGVLIACYLVYSLRIRANDAIRLVRKKRPHSVQMSGQILCVQQFEHYLLPQTVVFSSKDPVMSTKDRKSSEFTLRQYLYRQRATLHGAEERAFRELPKIVYCLCERLLKLCGCHQSGGLDLRVRNRPFYKSFLTYRLKQGRPPELHTPEEVVATQVPALPMVEWRNPIEEDIERNLESVSRLTGGAAGSLPAVLVHEAFLMDHQSVPDEKQKYLRQLRTAINQRVDAMVKIDEVEDPEVLTGLLFEWLEGLKQPVLDGEDLATIVGRCKHVEMCISALQMEDVILIEYLLRFVIRLRPLAAQKKIDIIKRLIASLTHQCTAVNGKSLPNRDFPKLRDGTCVQVTNFMLRMVVEIQKDLSKPARDDNDVVIPPRRLRIKAWK